ncbi:uncharacterized protein LOC62_05G007717 [Vanrija pseudolonga]|uniref:Uncharacterized protein n=1 Tax=Vanrija pseudolonga TaxID=143232 RepID=A0AAF0YE09_9TREE|nr:hypothetical protein LOC62_05G007717 [Vanrija pseudolonga]
MALTARGRSEPFHLSKYIVPPNDSNPEDHRYAYVDGLGRRQSGQVPVLRFASEVEQWLAKEEALYAPFAVAVIRAYVDYKARGAAAREVAEKLLALERQVVVARGLTHTADAFAQVRRERGLGPSSVLSALADRQRVDRDAASERGEHVPPSYVQAVDAAAAAAAAASAAPTPAPSALADQVRALVGLVARLESRVKDLEGALGEERERRRELEGALAVLTAERGLR